jgi:predicted component of type VI protein secretion system
MNVSLMMVKGDGTQRDFPMGKERLVIGRINTCDLRIALPSVSRQHCEVLLDNGQLKLRDLGSSNGTFHNNTRIQEVNLSAGDEIGVGPVVFRVVIDGKPAPTRAPAKPAPAAKPAPTPAGKAAAKTGVPLPAPEESEPLAVADEDEHSPTVDMDDPLAALAAAAADSGEGADDLPALIDDEDKVKPPPTPKNKKSK